MDSGLRLGFLLHGLAVLDQAPDSTARPRCGARQSGEDFEFLRPHLPTDDMLGAL